MKRIVATLVATLLAVGLAQAKDLAPGTIEVAGLTSGSFMMLKLKPDGGGQSTDIDVMTTMASAEYYIMPNLGVGGLLSYDRIKIGIRDDDVKVSLILVGPQAKYNFNLGDNLNAYAVGAFGYSKQTIDTGSSGDANGWFWRVGGGVQVFATDSVAIDLGLSYQMISEKITAGGAGSFRGLAASRESVSKAPASSGDVKFDVSGLVFGVGLSVFF